MNAGFDTLDNLISYSRRYAYEFLEPYPIELKFKVDGSADGLPLTGEQRRNTFLVIKEALNNIVKHAEATDVEINFQIADKLTIDIIDNGKGLENDNQFGNGLKNMEKRISSLGGSFSITSDPKTCIKISVPKMSDLSERSDI